MVRKVCGNYFLFPENCSKESGMPIFLNETGHFIFEEISKGNSNEAIAKKISEEYGIDYKEALSDVISYAEKLAEYI